MTYKLMRALNSETLDYLHRLAQRQPKTLEEQNALMDIREKLFWIDDLEIPQSLSRKCEKTKCDDCKQKERCPTYKGLQTCIFYIQNSKENHEEA